MSPDLLAPTVRVALVAPPGHCDAILAEELRQRLLATGAEVVVHPNCDDLDAEEPTFVLLLSPLHGRLTRYPTYGVLTGQPEDFQWSARLVRNAMTWDGCLAGTPRLATWFADVCFGLRKIFNWPLDLQASGEEILRWHAGHLCLKGYRPEPTEAPENLPSIGMVVRTGGERPEALLRRALRSLEAQQWPNLEVAFVCFRPFPRLPEIAADFPSLRWRIVNDFGRRRSSALRAGVAALHTELFGMLDDDDELFPNHFRTLVAALRRRNRLSLSDSVGMVHSGSVAVFANDVSVEGESWLDDRTPVLKERRGIEHFRWFRPSRMARHDNIFAPHSFLARRNLVDSEMLTDPAIHLGEDMDFQFLLVQKTDVAFSAEVTAIHHFHGYGQSNYQDIDGAFDDALRLANRVGARTLPLERQILANQRIFDVRYDPFRVA